MRTLVTGATGLLGNNIVRQLLSEGHEVRVLVRRASDPRPLAGLDVQTIHGDVQSAAAVRAACQGVQTVFHAAAKVHIGWTGGEDSQIVNVEGTRLVAEAAMAAGARMVHVSSIDALPLGTRKKPTTEETPYQEPRVKCPYPVTKLAGEKLVLDYVSRGLDAVIVIPGFMLGPWDWKPSSGRMLLSVAKGMALISPWGRNQFCGAVDVAKATIAAATRGRSGERYILSGELLTYFQAFNIFAKVSHTIPTLLSLGWPCPQIGGYLGDIYGWIRRREPDVNSASVRMATLPRFCSHEKATRELDYHPRPLRECATEAWHWFLEHNYIRGRK